MAEFDQLEPEERLTYLRSILNTDSSHALDRTILALSKSSAQLALDQVWKVSSIECTPHEQCLIGWFGSFSKQTSQWTR